MTFDDQGLCTTTVFQATFSSEASATAFVNRTERDYGRNYLGGSVDGPTATVTVNMSGSKLSRQDYEAALRTTAEGLTVTEI